MSVDVNLDGKAKEGTTEIKQILVAEDVHEGTIKDVVVIEGANFDSGAPEKKIVQNIELADGIVSKWSSPKITKGSGTYSSSNLFVLLEKANLLADFASYVDNITQSENQEERLATYLNGKLAGKKCKVLTKTVTKKDGSGKYSKVDKYVSIEN